MQRAVLVIAVLAVIAVLGSVAAADPPADPKPDENADTEAREANLESNAPREGVVFGLAGGFGVLTGGGVGRGGALSLRLGHVATRSSVITFELVGTGALHKVGTNDSAATDTNAGLFAGIQTYLSRATWFRLSGGPTVFTRNVGGPNQHQNGGVGGLAGAGFDLARWGYLVIDLEAFGMASVTGDGGKIQLGFVLGLFYY